MIWKIAAVILWGIIFGVLLFLFYAMGGWPYFVRGLALIILAFIVSFVTAKAISG